MHLISSAAKLIQALPNKKITIAELIKEPQIKSRMDAAIQCVVSSLISIGRRRGNGKVEFCVDRCGSSVTFGSLLLLDGGLVCQ